MPFSASHDPNESCPTDVPQLSPSSDSCENHVFACVKCNQNFSKASKCTSEVFGCHKTTLQHCRLWYFNIILNLIFFSHSLHGDALSSAIKKETKYALKREMDSENNSPQQNLDDEDEEDEEEDKEEAEDQENLDNECSESPNRREEKHFFGQNYYPSPQVVDLTADEEEEVLETFSPQSPSTGGFICFMDENELTTPPLMQSEFQEADNEHGDKRKLGDQQDEDEYDGEIGINPSKSRKN
jgi:hypothetical protein